MTAVILHSPARATIFALIARRFWHSSTDRFLFLLILLGLASGVLGAGAFQTGELTVAATRASIQYGRDVFLILLFAMTVLWLWNKRSAAARITKLALRHPTSRRTRA